MKRTLLILAAMLSTLIAHAGDKEVAQVIAEEAKAKAALEKPAWLSELSVMFREGYDSDLFQHDYIEPSNIDSGFFAIMPKLGLDAGKLMSDEAKENGAPSTLSLIYAPEVYYYHSDYQENYAAHRVNNKVAGAAGDFSYELNSAFSFVDGDRESVSYPNSFNAYIVTHRDRRKHLKEVGDIKLRYDLDGWFFRPVAMLKLSDFHLKHRMDVPGYLNYTDRREVNGGIDVGREIFEGFYFTLGYRYGDQFQPRRSLSNINYSNTYQRVLGGFEGKPLKWLTLAFQMGPDFRHLSDRAVYPDSYREGNMVRIFVDGTATAQITSKDSLSFEAKQYQELSSVGQNEYEETVFGLTYKRLLTQALTFQLGCRAIEGDYEVGAGTALRDDWMIASKAGIVWQINKHIAVDAEYLNERGFSDIGMFPARDFNRSLASAGLKFSF